MALPTVADRFSAQRSKASFIYSDFLSDFNAHPDNKQLMAIRDEAAVSRSIRNLLFTNKYERLFQPNIGGNLDKFLFEDVSAQTEASIRFQIIETIENYEPRAKLLDVIATGYPEKNGYVVSITFYVTSVENPITLNLPLYRVR
jgi:phage baseplate assembly protein W